MRAEDLCGQTGLRLRLQTRVWDGAASRLVPIDVTLVTATQADGRMAEKPATHPAGVTWGQVTLTVDGDDGRPHYLPGGSQVTVLS